MLQGIHPLLNMSQIYSSVVKSPSFQQHSLSQGHSLLLHLLLLGMMILRARAAGEVVRDHSSLAAEPEIEVTSAVEPSIQLPPSPHAIDYISLKMGSVALYSSKEGRREREVERERGRGVEVTE